MATGDFLLGLLGGVTEGGKSAIDQITQQRQFQAEQQFRQQQLAQQAMLAREEMALKREIDLYEKEEDKKALLKSTINTYVKNYKGKNAEQAIKKLRTDPEIAGYNAIYPNFQQDVEAGITNWFSMQAPKEARAKREFGPLPEGLTAGEATVARGTQALGQILPTARPTPQVGAQAGQFPFGLAGLAGGVAQPAAQIGRTVGRGVQAGITGETPPEPQLPKGLENLGVNIKGNLSDMMGTILQLLGKETPIPRR